MARNISWCLMRNLFLKNNFLRVPKVPVTALTRVEHSVNLFPDQSRHAHPDEPVDLDYHEVKSYRDYLNDSKIGLGKAILTLIKTLDVTRDNAIKVVREWKIFGSLSRGTILINHEILREHGVLKSTLRLNMYALADTTANVRAKIASFEKIGLDLNAAIPLFKLRAFELVAFTHTTQKDLEYLGNYKNRVEYLGKRLNIDLTELCEILILNIFMLQMDFHRVHEITEHLLENGMSGKHIVNDIYIYKYNMKTIEERLARAIKAQISPLKPWTIRCPIELIENVEKKLIEREALLKDAETLEEHISNVLKCDIQMAKALLERHPNVKSIKVPKLTRNLEFLDSIGYKIEDMYLSPMALHCDCKSMLEKYAIWTQHGLPKPSLFVLSTSKGRFQNKLEEALKYVQPKAL